jgi:transposase-like protein
MSKKRINRTKELKFKVAIEAIKGDKQISELAAQYNVHPNQISQWKKLLLDNGAEIFDAKESTLKANDKEKEQLYKTVGKQQVAIDWLKKNLGIMD